MKKALPFIVLLASIVYACNQQDISPTHLLSTIKLPTQVFSIDITRDTTLHTKNGALIRIPHGALFAANKTVQLEIKEAYSMQDMLKGGLTTMSNGQPLSSGGMIYINAVGKHTVKFNQPISIATPTPFLDSSMQLYKGNVQSDSTINWTDPKPLGENPQLAALQMGEQLFKSNCASCHAIDKDLTGPALGGALERVLSLYNGDKKGLYAFTRNPSKEMAKESYFVCLKNKFGGVVMTSFDLTDEELDNLYGYIDNETKRRRFPVSDHEFLKCKDSCKIYREATTHWKEVKAKLEQEVEMTIEKRSPTADTTGDPVKVSPTTNTSLYYQFNIEAFGWYNVDAMLKNVAGVQPSELMVRVKGEYKEQFTLYLIIPSVKLLANGGLLENEENTYGFDKADGSIRLPQNTKAFIIAWGEHGDQIIFSKTEFTTKEKQTFDLELTTITKEAFQQQIASLQLGDLNITANDTKNAAELRNAVKELKKAEQLKPQNCDCDCFLNQPPAAAIEDENVNEWGMPVSTEY